MPGRVTGTQFGIFRDEIVRFDPDLGKFEHYAFALDVWAGRVQEEADELGKTLVEAWTAGHPALGRNERLQPKEPLSIALTDPEYRVVQDIELMRRYGPLVSGNHGREGSSHRGPRLVVGRGGGASMIRLLSCERRPRGRGRAA